MDRETARQVEGALYGYNASKARLETLRRDLADMAPSASVCAQRYDAVGGSDGHVSDPVAARLERDDARRAKVEGEIRRLERWTAPIDRLLSDLRAPWALPGSKLHTQARLLELWYLAGLSLTEIADEMGLGKTALYQRRGELLALAAAYLGL